MEHVLLPPNTMLMLFHAVTWEFQVKIALVLNIIAIKNYLVLFQRMKKQICEKLFYSSSEFFFGFSNIFSKSSSFSELFTTLECGGYSSHIPSMIIEPKLYFSEHFYFLIAI